VARGTGGAGGFAGGDGIRKEVEFLEPCTVHLLADRRTRGPYGLEGGEPGAVGRDTLLRDGETIEIAGRARIEARPGDRLTIRTPGGGGFGVILRRSS
jgi:N-methylhydantoinase B/oxoprolinase/acetone carboxylase alpha subunit